MDEHRGTTPVSARRANATTHLRRAEGGERIVVTAGDTQVAARRGAPELRPAP